MTMMRTDLAVVACLWIIGALSCLGVVSSVMWALSARQVDKLESRLATQTVAMQTLRAEVTDQKYKISDANRMLAMAYPKAGMRFIAE